DEILKVLASAAIEYAAWALWFLLISASDLNPLAVFAAVLFPGLHIQHSLLISLSSEQHSFADLLKNPGFILFGLIEAIAGGLWLAAFTDPAAFPVSAHLILLIGITLEHVVQG